jgi:hypothetical protein
LALAAFAESANSNSTQLERAESFYTLATARQKALPILEQVYGVDSSSCARARALLVRAG